MGQPNLCITTAEPTCLEPEFCSRRRRRTATGEEPRSAQPEKARTQQPRASAAKNNLCNPMDCSLPGSSAHGILWTQILEWVAILFSRGSSSPGIEPSSLILQANSLLSEPPDSDHFLKWFIKKKKKRTEPERWWGRGACVACTQPV